MTVKVITNISSKQHAGPAYFRLDGKNQKIKNDLVDLNVSPGEHHIEIGYLYGGTELKHYVNDVIVEEPNDLYIYRVPLLLSGKGKLHKVGKISYLLYKGIRVVMNGPLFWVFVIVFAVAYFLIRTRMGA